MSEPVLTGTTIMAARFEGGIIIGADTRTSMGTYIPNRLTDKLTPLTDFIYCCRSGSSADTQIITRVVSQMLEMHELSEEVEPTVKHAAKIGSKIIYENPQLLAGLIIAGFDNEENGSIYSIPLGGAMIKTDWAIGGSGSAYIYGYCDYAWRNNMSYEETFEFVKTAVSLAIRRDNSSGGCIRLAVITRDGVTRHFVPGNEILPS